MAKKTQTYTAQKVDRLDGTKNSDILLVRVSVYSFFVIMNIASKKHISTKSNIIVTFLTFNHAPPYKPYLNNQKSDVLFSLLSV